MAHGEGLEAEYRLHLDQVLEPDLSLRSVLIPALDAELEPCSDQSQQGRNDDTLTARMTPRERW